MHGRVFPKFFFRYALAYCISKYCSRCITHGAFLQQDYAQRSQDGFLKVELFLQFYCLKGTPSFTQSRVVPKQ